MHLNSSVFQALKPEYDLSEEEVKEIFNMTDENNVFELYNRHSDDV